VRSTVRAPEFWRGDGWLSTVLAPAAAAYDHLGRLRRALVTPYRASVPVLCVGNLVVGGAGKTPVTLALAEVLTARGIAAHILTRGYRGRLKGPVEVDRVRHDFRAVGDEPLLLAAVAPTWVSRDRAAGGRAAVAAGARLILMDDGLQNPALARDRNLIVVDGGFGFGNGRVLPAGPLREQVRHGFARADGAVLIGEDRFGVGELIARHLPLARARLVPRERITGKILAFAGIGRPRKFFETLDGMGADLVACVAFPDHHAYLEREITGLLTQAEALGAKPITTSKDWVRLPPALRPHVEVLNVELVWTSPADSVIVDEWLAPLLPKS
jgi:tetraacyldisaccharide 4'-kinase